VFIALTPSQAADEEGSEVELGRADTCRGRMIACLSPLLMVTVLRLGEVALGSDDVSRRGKEERERDRQNTERGGPRHAAWPLRGTG
jgi:hypothetical protein